MLYFKYTFLMFPTFTRTPQQPSHTKSSSENTAKSLESNPYRGPYPGTSTTASTTASTAASDAGGKIEDAGSDAGTATGSFFNKLWWGIKGFFRDIHDFFAEHVFNEKSFIGRTFENYGPILGELKGRLKSNSR
jgi:hypothetical protein